MQIWKWPHTHTSHNFSFSIVTSNQGSQTDPKFLNVRRSEPKHLSGPSGAKTAPRQTLIVLTKRPMVPDYLSLGMFPMLMINALIASKYHPFPWKVWRVLELYIDITRTRVRVGRSYRGVGISRRQMFGNQSINHCQDAASGMVFVLGISAYDMCRKWGQKMSTFWQGNELWTLMTVSLKAGGDRTVPWHQKMIVWE